MRPHAALPSRRLALLAAAAALAAAPAFAQNAPTGPAVEQAARALLLRAIADPNTAQVALFSLRMANDPDLADLFIAYAASRNPRYRTVAVAALADLKGDKAAAALWERVRNDPEAPIRAQALALLIQTKAAKTEQLREAMDAPGEEIQYLAAGGLVSAGRGQIPAEALQSAIVTLQRLSESKDVSTAALARLGLLSLGRTDQLDPVLRILADPNAPAKLLTLMLTEIHEERIAALADPVQAIAESPKQGDDIRLHAYKALAVVRADGSARLAEAIGKSDKTVFRVYLLRMLTRQKDAKDHLAALAGREDVIGSLSQFELSRPAADEGTTRAAAAAVAHGHPIVVAHVLEAIRDDLPTLAARADCYVPVLRELVRQTPKSTAALRPEQEQSAWAAGLLADIGTEAALSALKDLLSGPFGEAQRATVAGLLKTANPAAAALAKPLLDSPYDEIRVTAALALARHGEKAALPVLSDILAHAHRHRPSLAVMAGWYALKVTRQHRAVLDQLILGAN